MEDWRDDFGHLARQLREDDQPEAVAQLLEHVGDLAMGGDELILTSVTLTRVRDTAEDLGRDEYIVKLDLILATLADEFARREKGAP